MLFYKQLLGKPISLEDMEEVRLITYLEVKQTPLSADYPNLVLCKLALILLPPVFSLLFFAT